MLRIRTSLFADGTLRQFRLFVVSRRTETSCMERSPARTAGVYVTATASLASDTASATCTARRWKSSEPSRRTNSNTNQKEKGKKRSTPENSTPNRSNANDASASSRDTLSVKQRAHLEARRMADSLEAAAAAAAAAAAPQNTIADPVIPPLPSGAPKEKSFIALQVERQVARVKAMQNDVASRAGSDTETDEKKKGESVDRKSAADGSLKTPPLFELNPSKSKGPWGVQQLRDSWSEDAMTRRDKDNMSERIHREYRYHPDEIWRKYIKLTAFSIIPGVLIGCFASYYYNTGKMLWEGDAQFILNVVRQADTSPRSKLYAYKIQGTDILPEHVLRHREEVLRRRGELPS